MKSARFSARKPGGVGDPGGNRYLGPYTPADHNDYRKY